MVSHNLSDGQKYSSPLIAAGMLGVNFNSVYQAQTVDTPALLEGSAELGFKSIRFPGGTITEYAFLDAQFLTGNWEASQIVDQTGRLVSVCSLDDFFTFAGELSADVTLVLPTRTAFGLSAAEALLAGSYGNRTEISEEFLAQTTRFLDEALLQAEAVGVSITRLELGNEFWGSGEMSANEYAYVAEAILELIASKYEGFEVGVQITASANRFSPLEDKKVWVENVGGTLTVIFEGDKQQPSEFSTEVVMPGNGSGAQQTETILAHLEQNELASSQITGVVDHLHFDAVFSTIDSQKEHALELGLEQAKHILGDPDLELYVTEWSSKDATAGLDEHDSTDGIRYAHLLVENFFRMTSEGVDAAMVWPLHFANENIRGRTLVDARTGELTFGGYAVHWLFTETEGLAPLLDYEVGGFDLHAFGSAEKLLIIAASRELDEVDGTSELDFALGEYGFSSSMYASVEILYSYGDSFKNSANPTLDSFGLAVNPGQSLQLDVPSWGMAKVSIVAISDASEIFHLSSGDDSIDGLGGNDKIHGFDGNDNLIGGAGDDQLYGGEGNDWLFGGSGENWIDGGAGFDTAHFEGNLSQFLISFISGADGGNGDYLVATRIDGEVEVTKLVDVERFQFADQTITMQMVMTGATNGDDVLDFSTATTAVDVDGATGDDTLSGGAYDDKFLGGAGNDTIKGNAGDDYIVDTSGRTWADGGDGQDIIVVTGSANIISDSGVGGGRLGEIDDILVAGSGNDSLAGGEGDDILIGDLGRKYIFGEDILDGGRGNDFLEGGLGADVFVFRAGDGDDVIGNIDQGSLSLDGEPRQRIEDVLISGADFETGIDKIYFVADSFKTISSAQDAFDSVYEGEHGDAVFFAEGTQITFAGVGLNEISVDDFLFI